MPTNDQHTIPTNLLLLDNYHHHHHNNIQNSHCLNEKDEDENHTATIISHKRTLPQHHPPLINLELEVLEDTTIAATNERTKRVKLPSTNEDLESTVRVVVKETEVDKDQDLGKTMVHSDEATNMTEAAGILFTAAALALANNHHQHHANEVQDMDIPLSMDDLPLSVMRQQQQNSSMRRIQSLPHMQEYEVEVVDDHGMMMKSHYHQRHNNAISDAGSSACTVDTSMDGLAQQDEDELQEGSVFTSPVLQAFVPGLKYRFDPPEFNSLNFPDTMDPHMFIETVLQCNGLSTKAFPALELQNFFLEPTDEHLDSYDKAVLDAVHDEDVDTLRAMFKSGKNLQCCNRFGESLLHMVCRRGFVRIAAFLIHEAGVSLRVRDDCGRTPLHDACWAMLPAYELVELLIAEEPDLLLISDKRGHTPFQYARREHWHYWRKFLYDRWDLICPRPGRETIMKKSTDCQPNTSHMMRINDSHS